MKKTVLLFVMAAACSLQMGVSYAQTGVAINFTKAQADGSAMLDVSSSSKGLLIPRVALTSTTDVITIASPATSLVVYNTNAGMTGGGAGFWYFDGTKWVGFANSTNAWLLTGNAGTSGTPVFLGTTDNTSLRFRTNNITNMLIDSLGRVGIGLANPSATLHVNKNVLIAPPVSTWRRNIVDANANLQLYNTGALSRLELGSNGHDNSYAGGEIIFTNDSSYATNAWGRIAFTNPAYGYEYLTVGTDYFGNAMTIMGEGPQASQYSNIKIGTTLFVSDYENGTNVKKVGIGNTSPAYSLDVTGQINASTGYKIGGAATSGQFLRGNGTDFVSSAIQAGDIPTLNQSTTGSAGYVVNSVTFNNSGSGAASGTTFNGSSAQTISYNTLGASPVSGSGNYIQNGTTQQTSSNFNISGNGIVGGNVGIGGVGNQGSTLTVSGNTGTCSLIALENRGASTGNTSYINFQHYTDGRVEAYIRDAIGLQSAGWNGSLVFGTASGTNNPTDRMTIASNGNVGIGTTAPNYPLDVNGDINSLAGYTIGGAATSGNYLRGNGTNFVSSAIQAGDIPSLASSYIQNQTASAQTAGFNINGAGTVGTLTVKGTGTGALTVGSSNSSNNTPLYVITNNGTMSFGVASYAWSYITAPIKFYINQAAYFNGNVVPYSDNAYSSGLSGNRWTAVYAVNGTIQTSDARFKENINDLNYGLKDILKLRPVSFTWKGKPEQGTKLGLIAQEVQPVIKEVVNTGDDANKTLGINYSEFVPILINAIKEQQKTIDSQQLTIGKQQAEIEKIKEHLGMEAKK